MPAAQKASGKIVLYAPGREFTIYAQRLHNGKKRIEGHFPYCRYPTVESIKVRFDINRNWELRAFFPAETKNQQGYYDCDPPSSKKGFNSTGDDLLFVRPQVSNVVETPSGWSVCVTENQLSHKPQANEFNSDADSGDCTTSDSD